MGHNSVAELYTGVEMTGQPVTVVVLRAQAGADHAVRSAFAEAVNRGSYSSDPGQLPIHAADLSAAQPWAASYQSPGRLGAERALDGLPGGGALETMSYQVHGPAVGPPAPAAPGWASPAAPASGWAPPPGGAPWAPPAPAGGGMSRGGLIALVGMVVLAVLLGSAAVLVLVLRDDGAGQVAAPVSPSPVPVTAAPSAPPSPSGPAGTGTPDPDSSDKPLLRQVNPVTVLGPSFATGDDTYTMAFRGWPFAFRTPGSWGCLAAEADAFPDARIWRCVDERNRQSGQRVDLVLSQCADGCPAARQKQLRDEWLDDPDKAVTSGERTHYVEYPRNDKGLYMVDASHFFGTGDQQWHLGVAALSPPETKDTVLKIFNDIVTQAG